MSASAEISPQRRESHPAIGMLRSNLASDIPWEWIFQGQFRVCIAETSRVDVQDLERIEAREVTIRYIVDYSYGYNLRAENNSRENGAR